MTFFTYFTNEFLNTNSYIHGTNKDVFLKLVCLCFEF